MGHLEIERRLREAGIENAAQESRWLCEALEGEALSAAVERRCAHYPLQYLLGEWDFYHQTYEVNEHCLIPRADTEILVSEAIRRLPCGARFLDLCTGSGCVAISTLCERADTTAVAVDLFTPTLELAARNAARCAVTPRVTFLQHDVLSLPDKAALGQFAAILSNPPYIRESVMSTLSTEVGFEPYAALCAGEDGLSFYRAILSDWRDLLQPGGFLLLEIGYDQADAVLELGAQAGLSGEVIRDLGGNDRVVYFPTT
jgi:release factor glutamine methyltransferase